MSIVNIEDKQTIDGSKQVEAVLMRSATNKKGEIIDEVSLYKETPEQEAVSTMVLRHFQFGMTNAYTPRVEFNDLSLINRDQYDQMAFNTYQPNNGEAYQGSPQTAWRSRALKPVVRNKCMSIAAHATARLLFPKVFAFDENSDSQDSAAMTMESLIEWSADQSSYSYFALERVIEALKSPASIGYTEYGEVMRNVKKEKKDGKWIEERIRDESYPCFMNETVPVTQLYIQNFYEPDIQKQGWIIWRKVFSYSEAQVKYGHLDNFKYVRPGVQTILNDANHTFYYAYDPNMRMDDIEEVTYWNKNLDLKIIKVNNIMLTDHDNPNPRQDKLYPFDKFGYELIHPRFFYYKDLAFKLQQDVTIINSLYRMVLDRTYLSIFPPMISTGGDIIASDVLVPGAVTTFTDPNSDLRPVTQGNNSLNDGINSLQLVERSLNESSQEPLQGGQKTGTGTTAYEISRIENNANTILGLFVQMIAKHVKDFGKLRLGDIVQYLTVPEISMIEGEENVERIYKTFFLKGNDTTNGKSRKIKLDGEIPDEMSEDEELEASYSVYKDEDKTNMRISRVNPTLFRELKYMVSISPDVLNPRSEDLIRAFNLETFDRMIAQPNVFDPEETGKLLLRTNPITKKDSQKFLAKQPQQQPQQGAMPQAGNSPLNALSKQSMNTPMLHA